MLHKWEVINGTKQYICLAGIVVSTSDCHPRGPGFDSRLYPRNFSGNIGSRTGSTQPREDNWMATWYEKERIQLRKLKLRLRNKRFANHKAPVLSFGSNHFSRSWLFGAVVPRIYFCGPGGSSGKVLGYGLDGPGSIPGVGGVEIFLHSFVSRLALGPTQPPIKWVPGNFPEVKAAERRTSHPTSS